MEKDNRGKGLVPKEVKINLEEARGVLEAIASTNESTVEESDLIHFAGYNQEQITKALGVVAKDLLDGMYGRARKRTKYATAVFVLNPANPELDEPESIDMSVGSNTQRDIYAYYPLGQSNFWFDREVTGLFDFRTGEDHVMWSLDDSFSIEKYRGIVRGLRWVARNLLNWDGEFILPEQLDTFLPPALLT